MNIKRLLVLTCTVLSSLTLVLMWLLFLSVPSVLTRAAGNTYTVCATGPCDYYVIQDAVDAASEGDVIKVAAGTYDDVNNYGGLAQVVYIVKSVTIQGGYTTAFTEPPDPVTNLTTLDAGGMGRVIYIEGNINPTIEGLRITGGDTTIIGSEEGGGGVKIAGSATTLRQNVIFNNTAETGGGVDMSDCAATLEANNIISNTATRGGGGLWMWQCDNSTLSENTISFNTAYSQSGGLWSGGGSENIIINDNTFSSNNSGGWSGGLELQGQGYSLVGNTISYNNAPSLGGIFLLGGEFTLIDNDIISNTGGGVILSDSQNSTFIGNNISYNVGHGLSTHGENIMVSGNTISHNNAEWGGGINNSGTLTLTNSTVSDNTVSGQGGGIYAGSNSSTVIIDSHILGNTAENGKGGGISGDGNVHLVNSWVVGNVAENDNNGGGINNGGTLTLTNSNVSDNTASGDGGGIKGTSGSSTIIMDSQIYSNTAVNGEGGGIRGDGSVHLVSSWVVGNVAVNNEGGGVSVSGSFYGENCIIAGNYAGTSAGGLWLYDINNLGGPFHLINCTVVGNDAADEGGAFATRSSSQIEITNTLIISNGGNTGIADRDESGSVFLLNYCDTYGNSPDGTDGVTITRNNCLGTTPEDGLDPMMAGGALPSGVGSDYADEWLNYDYRLLAGSPAINKGTPVDAPATDIEGNSRDAIPDIGAYEFPIPLSGVIINGPTAGEVSASQTFIATSHPISATIPVTYVWQATGQLPVTNTNSLSDSVAFVWETSGEKTISVTASNTASKVEADIIVNIIDQAITELTASNDGPTLIGNPTTLTATHTTGTNVSYDWDFGDEMTGIGAVVTHIYESPGVYTATVTASNSASSDSATTVVTVNQHHIYLPLVSK